MSLVSSRANLTHRCDIERGSNAGVDSGGWENTPNWASHLANVPCRAWQPAGREVILEHDSIVIDDEIRLILPLGTDVTEQDRVRAVSYRGATIYSGPLQIRAILTRKDHLSLILVKAA